jgi:hypothetical protein
MRIPRKTVLIFCLFYLLVSVVPVFAQEEPPPGPCVGLNVSGTVVAVDEAAMVVTLALEDGTQCTVVLDEGGYDHPVIALLGQYFDDVRPELLSETLNALKGCVLQVGDTWMWEPCETPGALEAKITSFDELEGFKGTLIESGTGIDIFVKGEEIADLYKNLSALFVTWQLDEMGAVVEVGDEIAAYHDAGIGFGVLVKLYAMAEAAQEACVESGAADDPACGISVEELVNQFNGGVGMGELFEAYGKPAMRGVGHIRQEMREGKGRPPWAGPKDDTADDEDPIEGSEIETEDQHGPPGHGNGNPNKDKPRGKDKDKPGRPDHAGPPDDKGKK